MPSQLHGKRIVVTQAAHQADELAGLLRSLGAEPLLYPCIAMVPPEDIAVLDDALRAAAAGAFHWLVVTSANTVVMLSQRLAALGLPADSLVPIRTAAVGASTAEAAERLLAVTVDVVPDEQVAEALAEALARLLRPGERVFLPQSDIARSILAERLAGTGAGVTHVAAYRTVPGSGGVDLLPRLAAGQVDAIVLTSSSTARNLVQRLQAEGGDLSLLAGVCIACIGPVTAKAARDAGLTVTVVAEEHSLEGLLEALIHDFDTP